MQSVSRKGGKLNISEETVSGMEGRCDKTKEDGTTNVENRCDEGERKNIVLTQIVCSLLVESELPRSNSKI
jgi:hypothetical protein